MDGGYRISSQAAELARPRAAAVPAGRRRIVMPWVGHNAAVLASQVRCATGCVQATATTEGPKVLTNLKVRP